MRPWSEAMQDALYGPDGYYTAQRRGPGSDYRTSSSASPAFAQAILELLVRADAALGHPDRIDFVEVASAGGGLVSAVAEGARTNRPHLFERARFHGVDLAPRPEGLSDDIGWSDEVPGDVHGLLFANELTEDGPRRILVGVHGVELLEDLSTDKSATSAIDLARWAEQLAWIERWWPLEEGDRAEEGTRRDALWADAVGKLTRGFAVTADYATYRDDREDGAFPQGTLVGYRDGRLCDPLPDGSTDITAHVAIDAVAQAGAEGGGAHQTLLTNQRSALKRLGVSAARPALELASSDPAQYMRELGATSEHGELLDPGGLGALIWLIQSKHAEIDALWG